MTELTDDANSIIENIKDTVTIKKIECSEVHEDVQAGKGKTNDLLERFYTLD